MRDITTWRDELASEMECKKDPGPVLAYAPDEGAFDVFFDCGYGGAEGPEVLAWTERRVYFPVVYDGAEWCESVPRNPCDEATKHVGGQ